MRIFRNQVRFSGPLLLGSDDRVSDFREEVGRGFPGLVHRTFGNQIFRRGIFENHGVGRRRQPEVGQALLGDDVELQEVLDPMGSTLTAPDIFNYTSFLLMQGMGVKLTHLEEAPT